MSEAEPLRLVCASANSDKVVEISELLDGVVELIERPAQVPEVDETADTLEGNARLKAEAIALAANAPAVADDTGLEVAALGGAPGVYAARYAGPESTYADNRAKLLAELTGIADRRAQFRTVVVVRWPDGRELLVEGVCAGRISETERGERGFGYDAVFIPDDGDGRTFAEMTLADKQAISHRGRAFRNLLAALRDR